MRSAWSYTRKNFPVYLQKNRGSLPKKFQAWKEKLYAYNSEWYG
jgi:hypothetical protein